MAEYKCPQCGGQLQATQKIYWSCTAGGAFLPTWASPRSYDWDLYCENDHELGTVDGDNEDVLTAFARLSGHDNA